MTFCWRPRVRFLSCPFFLLAVYLFFSIIDSSHHWLNITLILFCTLSVSPNCGRLGILLYNGHYWLPDTDWNSDNICCFFCIVLRFIDTIAHSVFIVGIRGMMVIIKINRFHIWLILLWYTGILLMPTLILYTLFLINVRSGLMKLRF